MAESPKPHNHRGRGGPGVSLLIFLKATFLLLLSLFFSSLRFPIFTTIPFLYSSIISFLVSIASHPSLNLPLFLGKRPDGSFPIWSLILFFPFLLFIRVFVILRRFKRKEPLFHEIADGVFVGGWATAWDELPEGELAVIDCTCELPRSGKVRGRGGDYLSLPVWDTRAPSPGEMEMAVRWAVRKRGMGKKVYVHCAYGHGRSVCVMCALLVELGEAEDWKQAEMLIEKKRPSISMNSLHRNSLDAWSKCRISSSDRKDTRTRSL